MSGPAARTWLRLWGAGRRRAVTPGSETHAWGWGIGSRRSVPSPSQRARLTVRPPRCQPGEREQRGFPDAQIGRQVSRGFRELARTGLDKAAPPISGRMGLRFRRGGRVCSEEAGRQKRRLWGRVGRLVSPSFLLPECKRERRAFPSGALTKTSAEDPDGGSYEVRWAGKEPLLAFPKGRPPPPSKWKWLYWSEVGKVRADVMGNPEEVLSRNLSTSPPGGGSPTLLRAEVASPEPRRSEWE